MKYLLDTMVISEIARPAPEPNVLAWLGARPASELAISVLSLGEITRGVALMPEGKRKRALATWLVDDLPALFQGRVLPVDQEGAARWGQLVSIRRDVPVIDGLLVGSAASRGLALVSRNVRDTAGLGVTIVDPWSHRIYAPTESAGPG